MGATAFTAAIIDDIIGIVVLSVLSALGDSSVNPGIVVLKILGFFVFAGIVGFIVYKLFKKISINHGTSRRVAVWAMAFCFIMAYCAERFFGVADITGAYFAGVILCNVTKMRQYVAKKVTAASYLVFSPVFFANIGLKTDLSGINSEIIVFAAVLAVMAVLTKLSGAGWALNMPYVKPRIACCGRWYGGKGRGSAYGGAKGHRQRKYRPKGIPRNSALRGYCRAFNPRAFKACDLARGRPAAGKIKKLLTHACYGIK